MHALEIGFELEKIMDGIGIEVQLDQISSFRLFHHGIENFKQ